MIGTFDVRVNAANPNKPLLPFYAYINSPSQVRVVNVPRKIGDWEITAVYVTANYPDNSSASASCTLTGGCWHGTLAGSTATGDSTNGFTITADGVKEDGTTAVTGYVLGKGDLHILDTDGQITVGTTTYYVHILDSMPTTPHKGDLCIVDSAWKIYNGTAWVSFGGGIGDVCHADFASTATIGERYTLADLKGKVNEVLGILKGTAAFALLLAIPAFGASSVLTAPLEDIPSDCPVVTNVVVDAPGNYAAVSNAAMSAAQYWTASWTNGVAGVVTNEVATGWTRSDAWAVTNAAGWAFDMMTVTQSVDGTVWCWEYNGPGQEKGTFSITSNEYCFGRIFINPDEQLYDVLYGYRTLVPIDYENALGLARMSDVKSVTNQVVRDTWIFTSDNLSLMAAFDERQPTFYLVENKWAFNGYSHGGWYAPEAPPSGSIDDMTKSVDFHRIDGTEDAIGNAYRVTENALGFARLIDISAATNWLARRSELIAATNGLARLSDIPSTNGFVTATAVTNIVTAATNGLATASDATNAAAAVVGAAIPSECVWYRPNDWIATATVIPSPTNVTWISFTTNSATCMISSNVTETMRYDMTAQLGTKMLDELTIEGIGSVTYSATGDGEVYDGNRFRADDPGLYRVKAQSSKGVTRFVDVALTRRVGSASTNEYYAADAESATNRRKVTNDAALQILNDATWCYAVQYNESPTCDVWRTVRCPCRPWGGDKTIGYFSRNALSPHVLCAAYHYGPNWNCSIYSFGTNAATSVTVATLGLETGDANCGTNLCNWALSYTNLWSKEDLTAMHCSDIAVFPVTSGNAVPDECLPYIMSEAKWTETFGGGKVIGWANTRTYYGRTLPNDTYRGDNYMMPFIANGDGTADSWVNAYNAKSFRQHLRTDLLERFDAMMTAHSFGFPYPYSGDSSAGLYVYFDGKWVMYSHYHRAASGPNYSKALPVLKLYCAQFGDTIKTIE